MLINGAAPTWDYDKLVEQLKALPSGFSKKAAPERAAEYQDGSESKEYNDNALRFYIRWVTQESDVYLTHALNAFQQAADSALKEKDLLVREDNLSYYAGAAQAGERFEESIPALNESIAILDHFGNIGDVHLRLGRLHYSLHEIYRKKLEEGASDAEKFRQEKLKPVRQELVRTFIAKSGAPVDPKAYPVEENEVGFSDDAPIGTTNLGQCLCLIVRDRVTKKTALAHIDISTEEESLKLILDRIPQTPDHPLEVRLVGAKKVFKDMSEYNLEKTLCFLQGTNANILSEYNLEKTLCFLQGTNANILSADILENDQPGSVVVDPHTFRIEEKAPGKPNPNKGLLNAHIAKDYRDLQLAFDLTCSEQRAPILIPSAEVSRLHERFLNEDEDSLYSYFKKYYSVLPPTAMNLTFCLVPVCIEEILKLREEYRKSLNEVIAALDTTSSRLQKENVYLCGYDRESALKLLSRKEIHVGLGAPKANAPLIDFIEKDFFVPQNGSQYSCDLKGLKNFRFQAAPYDTVAPSAPTRAQPAKSAPSPRS
ncbi:MAG: hypothetical protein PHE27_05620 [Alphaproteobacteria bacterium]|nr:hypothetical protein [Alphaproteobacteria bacterium]